MSNCIVFFEHNIGHYAIACQWRRNVLFLGKPSRGAGIYRDLGTTFLGDILTLFQGRKASKGQLISKQLFNFFNSPKKRTKNSAPIGLGKILSFHVRRHKRDVLKLTDL